MQKKTLNKRTGQKQQVVRKHPPGNTANDTFLGRNKHLLLLFAVGAITFIIYFPALHNSFTNWDDKDYVIENQHITALSMENIQFMFSNPIAVNYHPLTILSLALNYKFSGLEPFSYYLINILLHLLNILLTYFLVLQLFDKNKTAALFAAAIFALHPMHVESVAWIAERKDVLYTLFYHAGLIAYIIYIDRRKWKYLLLALILFIPSALSKPSAVVFPLVLFLIDFLRHRKITGQSIIEKIPFFIISVWIGFATINAQTGTAIADITNYTIVQKFLFVSYGFFIYIFKLLVPIGLSAFHQYPVSDKSLQLPYIYYLTPLINILIVAGALYSLKYTRLVIFGLLFYFLNIMLTIQFIQVGSAIVAERYTYVSYTGLIIILYWLINQAGIRNWIPRRASPWLMILFLMIIGSTAATRVMVWKNSETMWNDVIAKDSGISIAYNGRGNYYFDNLKYDLAIRDFTRSIELKPAYSDPYFNRGNCYLKTDPLLAIRDYSVGLSIKTEYARGYNCRGDAYSAVGKYDSAILDYNKAIALNPQYCIAYNNRSAVWSKLGNYDKVIEDCNTLVALCPEYAEAWFNLGYAFTRKGNYEQAILCFDKAALVKKNNFDAIFNRGLAKASLGKNGDALLDLNLAISLKPDDPSAYLNRAILFLITRKKDLACMDLQKAIQLGNRAATGIYNKECLGNP